MASVVSYLLQSLEDADERKNLLKSCTATLHAAGIGGADDADGQWGALFDELLATLDDWCKAPDRTPVTDGEPHSWQDRLNRLGLAMADQVLVDELPFNRFIILLKDLRQVFFVWGTHITPDSGNDLETVLALTRFFDQLEINSLVKRLPLSVVRLKKALRTARHALLYEKKRYYTIFRKISEPAFVVDGHLKLVDANPACVMFFNRPSRDLVGKSCCEVIGQRVCSICALEKALAEQNSFAKVETDILVGGIARHVLLSGTFLGRVGKEPIGGLVIIQDLTEKKRYEQALLESEEKYRSLIENVPEVTWRVNQWGHILYISPNIVNLTGYTSEEMMAFGSPGRSSRIHPEDAVQVRKEFNLLFSQNKKFDVKYRFRKKQGEWIWLHDRAGVIYERDGSWVADGVVSDVTELQKAYEELEEHREWLEDLVDERTEELSLSNLRLRQEIAERQKIEEELMKLTVNLKRSNTELEQFAHVASHDLKEPLLLIIAFAERLLHRFGENIPEGGKEYIIRILKSARQMQQLVEGLLQLSRVTTAGRPFESIDLNELLNEVVDDLEESIKQARARVEFGELLSLNGDRMQIRQLLQNIITNALKYRKEMVEPLVIVRSAILDDNFCEITIEDNGIGFDEKFLPILFKPFTRLDVRSKADGTGIGLTTCQKIVMRHGGEITARSTPDQGTVFIIRLPISHGSDNEHQVY